MLDIKKINFSDTKTLALASIALGILFVIFPSGLLTGLMFIVGLLGIVFGVFNIIAYFKNNDKLNIPNRMAIGLSFTALGLYFVINPSFIISISNFIFGLAILVFGFFLVQYAFDLKAAEFKSWYFILVAACICVILAVVILLSLFASEHSRMTFTGFSFIYAGVAQLFCEILLNRSGFDRSKIKKADGKIDATLFTSTFDGIKETVSEAVTKVNEKKDEVVEDLKEKASDAKEKLEEKAKEVKEKAEDTAKEAKEKVEEKVENAKK